ncbi:unnamed protein product [Ilex paraguariensis]|uniref:WAT1-related protein n=1 Tax=Ilex paraguariensis TaxID=185542 RepID=A0ABC8RP14_9AQUA
MATLLNYNRARSFGVSKSPLPLTIGVQGVNFLMIGLLLLVEKPNLLCCIGTLRLKLLLIAVVVSELGWRQQYGPRLRGGAEG